MAINGRQGILCLLFGALMKSKVINLTEGKIVIKKQPRAVLIIT